MSYNNYINFAKFRVLTLASIKSKRAPKLILRDIDKELTRICNSINRGYTLGTVTVDPFEGEYRPYRYFNITWTEIRNDRDLNVVITRGSSSITITEENWSEFKMWCNSWKITKPATIEECDNIDFYTRWW